MNHIAVDLMLKDMEFEEALAWAIASYGRGIFVRRGTGDKEIPRQHSIVLTDCMDRASGLLKLYPDIPVLYLADCDEQLQSLIDAGLPATCKYQSIIQILADISLLAAERLDIRIGNCKNTGSKKIITFAAADGGVGTTTLALAIAQYFKRYRSANCLYISFETWESTDRYMNMPVEKRGIEEFLYCIREGKKAAEVISSFTCRDDYGVETFCASGGINPLSRLSSNQTAEFINKIMQHGGYEYILIDASSEFSEAAVWSMENSSCNVFLSNTIEVGSKEKHAMAYLEKNTYVDLKENFIRVVNRQKDTDYLNFEAGGLHQDNEIKRKQHIIFEDEEGFNCNDGKIMINIDREFGHCISELVQEL